MNEANDLPPAISHKKLSLFMNKAQKEIVSIPENKSLENVEVEEFLNALNTLEISSKEIIQKITNKNKSFTKDKSSNAIMALGALEVHLNMTLQAINIFKNDKN